MTDDDDDDDDDVDDDDDDAWKPFLEKTTFIPDAG
jgi:hypothetical protein